MKTFSFFRRGWHLTLLSALLLFVFLIPLLWMVSTALKSTSEIYSYPPKLISLSPDWTIWSQILTDPEISRFFVNSLVVSFGTTFTTLCLAVPCAYGLAHLPVKGKTLILGVSLSTLVFPAIMTATPLYIVFGRLGMLNTYPALILADTAISLPFAIVMLRPSFRSVPKELAGGRANRRLRPLESVLVDHVAVGRSRHPDRWRVYVPSRMGRSPDVVNANHRRCYDARDRGALQIHR